jgi:hypothetical protein
MLNDICILAYYLVEGNSAVRLAPQIGWRISRTPFMVY